MNQWIIWRHAEAGHARSDLERPLTERGQQQAADSAAWLKAQGIDFPAYSSAATRAQQTVRHYHDDATSLDGLNPDNGFRCVCDTLQPLLSKNAVIVGHLPWVNYISSELTGQSIPTFGYSSICWLEHDNGIWTLKTTYRF